MSALPRVLARLAADLRAQNAPFAMVGGLAVSVRAEPRFTRDIDLAVAVANDSEAEALVRSLASHGYRLLAQAEHDRGRLATVRIAPPAACEAPEGLIVDLLFASSGIEADIVRRADVLEVFPAVALPVARLGDLLALKVLAAEPRRPQDRTDASVLLGRATASDVEDARAALRLITDRGFARGKDLERDFDQWLGAEGP